jgi:hypothetical protein
MLGPLLPQQFTKIGKMLKKVIPDKAAFLLAVQQRLTSRFLNGLAPANTCIDNNDCDTTLSATIQALCPITFGREIMQQEKGNKYSFFDSKKDGYDLV